MRYKQTFKIFETLEQAKKFINSRKGEKTLSHRGAVRTDKKNALLFGIIFKAEQFRLFSCLDK